MFMAIFLFLLLCFIVVAAMGCRRAGLPAEQGMSAVDGSTLAGRSRKNRPTTPGRAMPVFCWTACRSRWRSITGPKLRCTFTGTGSGSGRRVFRMSRTATRAAGISPPGGVSVRSFCATITGAGGCHSARPGSTTTGTIWRG